MKILLVITKAEIGGAQAFVLSLAKGLQSKGQQVAVAAGDGDYLPSELAKFNIDYFYLKSLKRSRSPLLVFYFIRELFSLLKREKFTVLHLNSTNTLPGAIAARCLNRKIKTIFTIHGLSVLDRNYQASYLVKFLFRSYFQFFLHFIDKTVFVSKYNLEEAKKQGIASNGVVIYNGLDFKPGYFLSREAARQELSSLIKYEIKDSDYIIGSIGRLAVQKNYDFLIKLWPEIKERRPAAKFVIIGEGPEREKLEELINITKATNDLFLPGETTQASLLLKGFDLFLLPSIYEGLSISLIEAVFAGVLVIASDVGGNSEVIGIENCFQLTKDSLLDKLQDIKDLDKKDNIFTSQEMVSKYLEVYE
jgi:glycosyltransferase involved in cell wall biosynthesis